LWTDESKFNSKGSDGKTYVRRRSGEEFSPKCTKATVKHDPNSVMVWGCFFAESTGPIHRINGTMDQHIYTDEILDGVLRTFIEESASDDWIFQVCHPL
jgi:hypothetical protein